MAKKVKTQINDISFLSGGGEMGALIRAKDWGETLLGPAHTWPQSLRTTLSIILNSKFPMFLFWGPELICFYNDAYRPSLGNEGKHPSILGMPGAEAWPEIWAAIKPLLDQVLSGGEATWSEDQLLPIYRNGKLEDVYWTFSYSPVYDESGHPAGVFVTCTETTEKVKIFGKLQEANKRFLNNIMQAPVAICVFRGPEHVLEVANDKMLELWGTSAETVMDKPIFVGLPEAKGQGLEDLLAHVYNTGARFLANERPVELPRGGKIKTTYINFTYEALREADGSISGVLAVANEVTDQVVARKAIEESQAKLEFAIEATELGTFDYDPHTNTFYANARYRDWLGMPAEGPIDLILAMTAVAEEDRTRVEAALRHSFDPASGGHFDIQYGVTNATTGKSRLVHTKGRTSFDEKGVAQRFNGTVQDVTGQVQNRKSIEESEERFRTMAEGTDVLIGVADETSKAVYFNQAWTNLTGRSMHDLLNFGWADLIHPDDKDLWLENYLGAFEKKIAFTGEFRLLNKDGGYTWVLADGPPRFRSDGSFAGYISACVDITERKNVEDELRNNEQKFRSLVESAPFALAVYVGEEMRIELANQAIIDIWGKGNDVIGKLFSDVLPELKTQQVFEQIRQVYSTGIPFHIKNQRLDLVIDGKPRIHYFNYSFTPVFDARGNVFGVMNTGVDLTELNLAKLRIEESEQRFRNNVKQAPIGIAIFRGPEFIVELANETYLQLVDRNEKDFVGRPLFDSLPEVKDVVDPLLKEVYATGIPFYATDFPVTLHRFGQDELTYFNLAYQPLREDNGEITRIMVVATEVTSSVKAKLQLEESEKRFRSLVMSSSVPMAVLRGPDHIIEMANAVLCEKIWRKKGSEVLGRKILDVFPELAGQQYPEQLRHVYTTGLTVRESEAPADVMGDDGMRRFYVDFEYAPLKDTDGNISAILITSNDVTEKVEARKKIEEAGERLRLATEATELSTWDLDLITDEIIHSPRLSEIFGHDNTVHVTHPKMKEQLHPADQDMVRKAFKKALDTGIYKYEARVIKPNGDICWIHTRGKVIYDADGKPVKMIGTLRDATEEKYYQQQLEEREQKFRLLADSMPQQIWTGDPQGNLNYFNQSVYVFSGLTEKQIEKDGWIQIVHDEDRDENIRVWIEAVTTGNDFLFEHRFRRHDGEYRWQLSRAIPQRDADGKIQMWVGTSTDIHEQKTFATELERQVRARTGELQDTNNELERMNTELKSFAYVSSHDMQEPLRKIQTFANRLISSEKENLSEEGRFYLTRVQDAATRMRKLIEDLLSYSRLNNTEHALEKMNINIVVQEVADELKEIIQEKKATITIDELCETKIIPFQFHQLFLNLISNSLKFSSPERQPHIEIKSEIISGAKLADLKLSEERNYCHIIYSDNGIGFESEYSDKIFKVFQRLHPMGKYDGTGIGLAIVKKIVENHNGAITAEGETDKGATFNIYIPVL
jgi:PAS domain S-box-containing protein